MHAHVLPDTYIEVLPPQLAATHRPLPVEALDAVMRRYAIDAAVVSAGPPGVFFGDQGQAGELARILNEELATVVRAAPQRFAALASLPLPDVDAAVAELGHALDALQLDGVMLLSQVGGTYLGDQSLDPLMAELDRRAAYVFVHPTFPPNGQPLPHPIWLYEFPFETTRAIANLIYSGAFERHPNIRWQFAHWAEPRRSSRRGWRRSPSANPIRPRVRPLAHSPISRASTTTPASATINRRSSRRCRWRRSITSSSAPTGRTWRCRRVATSLRDSAISGLSDGPCSRVSTRGRSCRGCSAETDPAPVESDSLDRLGELRE